MMRSALYTVAAALLAFTPGCGDDGPGQNPFADGGPRIDASLLPDGSVNSIDASTGDASTIDAIQLSDAPVNAEGPVVLVLSPAAPAGLGSDQIVVDDRFTARCRATDNPSTTDPVDPSSVLIDVIGVGGVSVSALAQPTTVAGEYEATLSVPDFVNGGLIVRCTASDLASTPRANSDEITSNIDLGPTVLIFSPLAGASISGAVEVIFSVAAAPVAGGDTGATVDASSVTMAIAGVDLTGDLAEDPVGSGVYRATINFEDLRFTPSLDGEQQISVTAANTRSPAAVTRSVTSDFVADSDGPVIEVIDPLPAGLVSGIFTISASVLDAAGVDTGSVVATIAGVHELTLNFVSGDLYQGNFDSRILSDSMVFPNLVIRAQDVVGNQSSLGQVVTLDNRAPILSLDPPDMREAKVKLVEGLVCSHAFDPVGADAASDGEAVPQLMELRVRVEDLGNGATTGNNAILVPHAGVDDAMVQLFILDDSSRALVVDTDGDGICDDIDPNLVPTSVPLAANEAAVIDLAPMEPGGESNYVPPVAPVFGGGFDAACNEDPTASTVPKLLCPVTSPTFRVPRTEIGEAAIIYAIPPQSELQCLGNGFDAVATNISDGWACVVVRAVDRLGNVGVSAPMRICIDADGDESECPSWGTITSTGLDDCTGTYNTATTVTDPSDDCTPPASFVDFPGFQLRRTDL